ncbi:hypothetical protein FTO70_09490 [Methanosarcina sp. KYL-1]|uniref:hypothetical protein n=1 Tax=Methanosarcina sp. KYL-1 TaxID=2602068 RepID=UPI0021012292|nr:hypothetical protein [Methanosarcina sp. KYL-1]MCQ1535907.1 hypothetical protein [Methanosarcina sp. KYL-1]
MRWKISAFLIVAILALSTVAAVQACACIEPCGTKVVQCDQDSTFALERNCPAEIVLSDHGTYYIDLTPYDYAISEGDVRITWYHNNYGPNTMVGVDDIGGDAGDQIVEVLDEYPLVCFLDIKDDGFDIEDPVYFDLDGDTEITPGDIRVTASPALDVYNENGVLIYEAGEFGEKWTVVAFGDKDTIDPFEDLCYIGCGYLDELVGFVDSDCDGEWSAGDKLYLNQPHDELNHHFDYFATIGDVRLYIPLDDECVPECGTKVLQGDFDATYALMVFGEVDSVGVEESINGDANLPQIGTFNDVEVYLDMDGDGEVSVGDIRLSSVSNHYEPNTKVAECDYYDLGHQLCFPDQNDIIHYYDFDANYGYSLVDPIYIDLDYNDYVSNGDIRLSQVPVIDTPAYMAGDIGMQWSVVVAGPGVVDDDDAGWYLEEVPNAYGENACVWELLGYVDSDCSGDWTCVDKLYLQQMVETDENHALPHNKFVTIGDLRIYVPPEAIEEEGWYDCGTKVTMCDIDVTHALYWWPLMNDDLCIDIGFFDKNDNDEFDVGEAAYIDMDGDGEVSIGDIRLTEAVCKYTTYPPNTKVLDQHAEDLERALNFGPGYCDGEFGFGYLFFVDLNDNDVYDVTDPLYIETDMIDWDAFPIIEDVGPSPGDIRLTQVPVVDGPFGPAGSIGEAFSQIEIGDRDLSWQFFKNTDPEGMCIINPVEWYISIFDVDCSGDWTCSDILYLKQITECQDIMHAGFVTAGDFRLFVPPEYIDEDPQEPPVEPEYNPYDANEDCIIQIDEMMDAIGDWKAGSLSMEDMMEVICYWKAGTPYC